MKQHLDVVRAISAEYLRRTATPFIIIGGLVLVLLLAGCVWLVTTSWWWLIALLIIGGATMISVVSAIIALTIIKSADTAKTAAQKQAVNQFVDTLEKVAGTIQVPQFVIVYRIVRDVILKRENGFVRTLSTDTKSLAPACGALHDLFTSSIT